MKRVMVRHHNAMACHIHHSRRHDSTEENTYGSYDEDGAELGHACSHSRLQEVHCIVAHAHEQVKHREAEQEHYDYKINSCHKRKVCNNSVGKIRQTLLHTFFIDVTIVLQFLSRHLIDYSVGKAKVWNEYLLGV